MVLIHVGQVLWFIWELSQSESIQCTFKMTKLKLQDDCKLGRLIMGRTWLTEGQRCPCANDL